MRAKDTEFPNDEIAHYKDLVTLRWSCVRGMRVGGHGGGCCVQTRVAQCVAGRTQHAFPMEPSGRPRFKYKGQA